MKEKWWHEKVAYQIYPKSFLDTNSDGIGDLQGVIAKLDYLKELGIDIIWLSPIYCSPLADQGYDISDYYNIDPRFGTMADMDELLAKAKKKDMYILMDLVVNHCSDEHPWFQKALQDMEGEYGRYFYIEEGKNGNPPTNWRSYFGGSAWEPIKGTNKYYLHLFHKKQPDLNWENPIVREEIYKMINWWLDKGLAGFRIDAIINIKKALPLKDYPVDREDGLSSISYMLEDAKGVEAFLHEMNRQTFQKYDAFTVGEVFNEKEGQLQEFIGEEGCFSSMFDFGQALLGKSDKGWYDCKDVTPEEFKASIFESQKKVNEIGFLSNIIENHDEPRGVNQYIPKGECNDYSKKALAAVSFMRKGLSFIYQGQEIGMENTWVKSIEEVDDIAVLEEYKVTLGEGYSEEEALQIINKYSRDNARTPMQWNTSEQAGFTTGKAWLTPNSNYQRINVEMQQGKKDSLYYFYQKLIELRKADEFKEIIVYGSFEPVMVEQKNIIAYYRKSKEQALLVMANFQLEPQEVNLDNCSYKVLLNNYDNIEIYHKNKILLHGYQVLILEMK